MDHEIQKLHDQVNQAIIRCRRVYSVWAKKNKVSYNRMLVLYTIREFGFCTQKQICDSYLLPRQTVNHVISEMKKDGILVADLEKSTGKEKALVLTPEGERYSEKLLYSLSRMDVKQNFAHPVTENQKQNRKNKAKKQSVQDCFFYRSRNLCVVVCTVGFRDSRK